MDLNLIKKPVITEKSTTNAQFNKYIFEVRNDANKLSIKSYQSFAFVLLIYFMSSSLRVFGISPYIFDLLELLLIIVFFVLCIFAPKNIRKNM